MRALLLIASLATACGGPSGGAEAGRDAGRPTDGGPRSDGGPREDGGPRDGGPREDGGPGCTEPRTDGCPCASAGSVTCGIDGDFGHGIQCCGGRWQEFYDSPCFNPDAGTGTACGSAPQEGCPCGTEGMTACASPIEWRLVCRAGTWQDDVGWVCC